MQITYTPMHKLFQLSTFIGLFFLVVGNINAQSVVSGKWDLLSNNNEAQKIGAMTATSDSLYITLDAHPNQVFDVKYRINNEKAFSGQSIDGLIIVIQGRMAKANNNLFGLTLRLRNRETDEKYTYIVKGVRKE